MVNSIGIVMEKSFENRRVKELIQAGVKRNAITEQALSGPKFPLRPSSAMKSSRDLYYELVNFYRPGTIPTTPIEGRNLMLLDLGHAIEKNLVKHISRSFEVAATSIRVSYGTLTDPRDNSSIEMSGELDFVLRDPETNGLVICDSKTASSYAYKAQALKQEHIAQINLYMHSDYGRKNKINRAWVIYYKKDDSDIRVMEFSYSAELAIATLERFQTILNQFHAGVIPNREHVFGQDWQPNYSPFTNHDLKEFAVPFAKRPTVEVSMIISDLGTIADQIRTICTQFGNAVVTDFTGKQYYLTAGLKSLELKSVDKQIETIKGVAA